jgi:hypothetical protein
MAIQRERVTPIAAGAFLLSAITGVLIFFHVDSGLSKLAHEWLSWALLGGVVCIWPPIRALSAAPLTTLVQVAGPTPEQLWERSLKAGLQPVWDQQSLSELTGPELRKQVHIMNGVFAKAK